MNKFKFFCLFMMGLLLSQPLFANQDLEDFATAEQAQQYQTLLKELRCVTCPNQSIADSQASVAKAMQEEIYQRIVSGESPQSIREFLLSRYGDYVAYRPLVKKQTYALWYGPAILLLLGILLWGYFIRKRGRISDC